jgi:hypothetical protein
MNRILVLVILTVLMSSLATAMSIDGYVTISDDFISEPILDEENGEDLGTLPDSPFYGFKMGMENLRFAFTFNNHDKAEYALELANKRLLEMQAMGSHGKSKGYERAVMAHEEAINRFKREFQYLEGKDAEDELENVLHLENRLKLHEEKMLRLEEKFKSNEDMAVGLKHMREKTFAAKSDLNRQREEAKQRLMKKEGFTSDSADKRVMALTRERALDIDEKAKAVKELRKADVVIHEAEIRLDKARDLLCYDGCLAEEEADVCAEKCLTPLRTSAKTRNLITGHVLAPILEYNLPLKIEVVDGQTVIDLDNYFTDPDGRQLSYEAAAISDLIQLSVTRSTLTITSLASECIYDTLTVTATDVEELSVTASTELYICPRPDVPQEPPTGGDDDKPTGKPTDFTNECGASLVETICHNAGNNKWKTITVSYNAVAQHMAHGDYCDECVYEEPSIVCPESCMSDSACRNRCRAAQKSIDEIEDIQSDILERLEKIKSEVADDYDDLRKNPPTKKTDSGEELRAEVAEAEAALAESLRLKQEAVEAFWSDNVSLAYESAQESIDYAREAISILS